MIKTIFYTLLIMAVLGVVLIFSLAGQDYGKQMVQAAINFVRWKPAEEIGILAETQQRIEEFIDVYGRDKLYRDMTVNRYQRVTVQYDEAGQRLKGDGQVDFANTHAERQTMVRNIIQDEKTLVGLNREMDRKLHECAQWLIDRADSPEAIAVSESRKTQQYENLFKDLKIFKDDSFEINAERAVLMAKSVASVGQLEAKTEELENLFSKMQTVTPEEFQTLRPSYEGLVREQTEIIKNMQANQDALSQNHSQFVAGLENIYRDISSSTASQREQFQENYDRLQAQQKALKESAERNSERFRNASPTEQRQMIEERNRDQIERMRNQIERNREQQQSQPREDQGKMYNDSAERMRTMNDAASVQRRMANDRMKDQLQRISDAQQNQRLRQDQNKNDQERAEQNAEQNAERMENARQTAAEQRRVVQERMENQMQRLKDAQKN